MRIFTSDTTRYAPYGIFVLRLFIGIVFAAHGLQKLMGGVAGVAGFLGSLGFPLPTLMAMLLIAAELGLGIFLILGLWTRFASIVLAFVALVAMVAVHLQNGFFIMSGGYEYTLVLLAACITLAATGPGAWTIKSLSKN